MDRDWPGTPTATITGTTEELARWAWGRGDAVETTGEEPALQAIDDVLSAGIQ